MAITRDAEWRYSPITALLTKTDLILTANFYREKLNEIVELFSSIATNTQFKSHELRQVKELTDFETLAASKCPRTVLTEELFSVSYKNELGNKIYCSQRRSNEMTTEKVSQFISNCPSEAVLSSVGVGLDELASVVEPFQFSPQSKAEIRNLKKFQFSVGNLRMESDLEESHIAFGFENAGDYFLSKLLQTFLGPNEIIKYSQTGHLQSLSSFTQAHDNLFIIGLSGSDLHSSTDQLLTRFNELKDGKYELDFKKVLQQTLFDIEQSVEHRNNLAEYLASGQVVEGKATEEQFRKYVSKIFSQKPSSVALGDLERIPYQ